ncbi:MAG: protein translocase subunit SecD [Arcanobacterium sp.]|nr:protein translocase subunit SecD [Arcanobacterium sp.]
MTQRNDLETQSSPLKRLITLGLMFLVLIGTLIYGTITGSETRFKPSFALDLEGGTQLILTPVTTDGSEITTEDVNQAIEIIRQRVDASGVAEAEITAQGGKNIVVALPGTPKKETLDLVRTSAVLRLRPVITMLNPNAVTSDILHQMLTAEATQNGTEAPAADKTYTDAEILAEITRIADENANGTIEDTPAKTPENSSDDAWITEKLIFDAYQLQCGSEAAQKQGTSDVADQAMVACASDGSAKYILGPADIEGVDLTNASSNLATDQNGNPSGGWAVSMQFNSKGAAAFLDVTTRLYQLQSPKNLFAIVLDGKVLSAPAPSGPIAGGTAQITGNFTANEAATLANQLSFGSLPLNFEVQSEEQISATLGSEQLVAGLWAGLIGLLLIVAYMIWQYHGLGILAVASIILATGLSYFVICLLSWTMGYRLSMAGVLGLIISIGVTADSFIVYFERIRDEIRDGRNIKGAIKHGWDRAKRTIIISDFVNLLAAVVLYLLTVGSVRGFAFTLGLTTVLDLVVVMMFTYPIMHALGGTAFFGEGKKFSGLNVEKLRAVPSYRGRGSFELRPEKKGIKASSVDSVTSTDTAVNGAGKESSAESSLEEFSTSGVAGKGLAARRAAERRAKKLAAAENKSTGDSVTNDSESKEGGL